MPEATGKPGRVVIIGASVAGVLAARVMSDHATEVVLVDRDRMPERAEPRDTVPQEHHVHLLLQRGKRVMESLFPGFLAELEEAGAEVVDLSHGVKWFQAGLWKTRWPTGIEAHYCTRTLVEHTLRRRTAALHNVRLIDRCEVEAIVTTPGDGAICGLTIRGPDGKRSELAADLVIDASGRGSKASEWLRGAGFAEVEREQIVCKLGYASRLYRRNPDYASRWRVLLISPKLPQDRRIAVVTPVEDNRWMVTAGGWFGEFPDANEESFLSFLKSMPVSDAYDAISGVEPLSDVRRFRLPGGLRRRYERLPEWPSGFLVMGDALCSFNPIYSQGMSVCAMQAQALLEAVIPWTEHRLSAQLVQRKIAEAVDSSWAQASSSDLRFPELAMPATFARRVQSWYFDALIAASARNRDVQLALLRIVNLVAESGSVYRPRLVWAALKAGVKQHAR